MTIHRCPRTLAEVSWPAEIRSAGEGGHDLLPSQCAAHPRAGAQHHRYGSAVRHAGRAFLHDSVDRGADGPLVLLAATRAHQTPSGYGRHSQPDTLNLNRFSADLVAVAHWGAMITAHGRRSMDSVGRLCRNRV